jgi:hypothetical protein
MGDVHRRLVPVLSLDEHGRTFSLECGHDGAKHQYTPDALVVCATHQMVVEVKENEVKEDKDTESAEA